ncbi:MAG: protein translocase SEC61 complex subunit gamma [Candidatus Woesearchaeota archaeon]
MNLTGLKSFYTECVRVFKITKKPTKEEFKAIVKISGLGILLIGFIGFLIHMIDQFI